MKSTPEMRARIRELMTSPQDDYDRAVECVLDDLDEMIAGHHSISEQADEATSYHKFWIEERGKRIAAEKTIGKVRTLAGEVERCEHGHFLVDIAKAIRALVSGSTEGGNV